MHMNISKFENKGSTSILVEICGQKIFLSFNYQLYLTNLLFSHFFTQWFSSRNNEFGTINNRSFLKGCGSFSRGQFKSYRVTSRRHEIDGWIRRVKICTKRFPANSLLVELMKKHVSLSLYTLTSFYIARKIELMKFIILEMLSKSKCSISYVGVLFML